jgi:hypothetical protein
MDTDTITLTPALRADMVSALKHAIVDGVYGDHYSYLETLRTTPDGTEIGPKHELADVLTYFQLHEF